MAHIRVTGNIGQETRTYLFCVFLLVEVVIGGGGGGGGGGDGGGGVCVRASVRACVRACVRVCVVCVCTHKKT